MRFSILLGFAFLSPGAVAEVNPYGVLLEKGTRAPIAGANVFLLPSGKKALTGKGGHFRIEGDFIGPMEWIVSVTGYGKLKVTEQLESGTEIVDRTLYLERESYTAYETTIYGKGNQRDGALRKLRRSDFLTAPGSGGDPVKAVQDLPGINRPAPFSAQVLLQGSGPSDTRYSIDGHEVPLIFHFGGLSTVLFPEALDRVDVFSAGYGPERGRAGGGHISLWTKSPETDRTHGLAFVDTFNAGGLVEGKAGEKGKFLLSGRQSYIGSVLRAVLKDQDGFDLTVAPTYSDLTGIYETKLTERDDFRVTGVFSRDRLEFLLKQPLDTDPAIRGSFENETAYFRLIPQLEHRHSDATVSRWSLGMGRDWISVDFSDNYFKLKTWQLSTRGEVEHRSSETWKSYLGMDHRATHADVQILAPIFYEEGGIANPFSLGSKRTVSLSDDSVQLGFYGKGEWKPFSPDLTLMPGARVDWFQRTKEAIPVPRIAARWEASESTSYRAASGIYAQPPTEAQSDPTFGNPRIRSPLAYHAVLGVDRDFRGNASSGWVANLDGFYKFLDRQVVRSVTENYRNDGKGRVIGAYTQVRYEDGRWKSALAYTLSRSTRWRPGQKEYPFEYDQTHLLGLKGSVEFGRHWTLSSRIRYATGNPVTPVTGSVYDADNDVYVPTRGDFFSDRLPPFFQTDVRIDRRFIFDRWILSAYLDIQNLTNRRNPEGLAYSYDYRNQTRVSGLPVLPTFGLKGEF